MPLYEYRCQQCGETSEFLQRFDDPPETSCPKCGGSLEKLLSAPAFHLKGSGWYKTDYAGSGSAAAAGAKEGSTESSGAKSESGGGDESSAKTAVPAETGSKTTSGESATKSTAKSPAKPAD